jgi:hypothetical protein
MMLGDEVRLVAGLKTPYLAQRVPTFGRNASALRASNRFRKMSLTSLLAEPAARTRDARATPDSLVCPSGRTSL